MKFEIAKYKTILLDCDGVILDSNRIKTEAFFQVALPYGEDKAKALVEYHEKNGGVSRFKKFHYFFFEILGEEVTQHSLDLFASQFERIVQDKLIACKETTGLRTFLERLRVPAYVISGAPQKELQLIFQQKQLTGHFRKILGSPQTKYELINSISHDLVAPVLFIGDSKLDYEVANHFNFDFVFISSYTEFREYLDFFVGKDVSVYPTLENLI